MECVSGNEQKNYNTEPDDGERKFSFYRKPGADMMLSETRINENVIGNANVFTSVHYP